MKPQKKLKIPHLTCLSTSIYIIIYICIYIYIYASCWFHLKNISQNGNLPQIGLKIKNICSYHPVCEYQALNSKCWHWLHWINKFHPIIFKLQDFRSSTERSSETHGRLQPASSTNSKRTKSRTCNVTDSTASRMELSDFAKKWGNSLFVSGKSQLWETNKVGSKVLKMNYYPTHPIHSSRTSNGILAGPTLIAKKTSWRLDSQHQKPYSLLCGDSK